jgi:hypothetical protein
MSTSDRVKRVKHQNNLLFKHMFPGDTFEVDRKRYPEDEWFRRGKWMRLEDSRKAVCLEQGVSNEGALKHWEDDIPVVLLEARTLPVIEDTYVPEEPDGEVVLLSVELDGTAASPEGVQHIVDEIDGVADVTLLTRDPKAPDGWRRMHREAKRIVDELRSKQPEPKDPPKEPEGWGVHRTHCCILHGCKYSDDDCPVANKKTTQAYPCEQCGLITEGYGGPPDPEEPIMRVCPTCIECYESTVGSESRCPTCDVPQHDLYRTGDPDAPDSIKDGNGEVALGLCRVCGKGEAELEEPCTSVESILRKHLELTNYPLRFGQSGQILSAVGDGELEAFLRKHGSDLSPRKPSDAIRCFGNWLNESRHPEPPASVEAVVRGYCFDKGIDVNEKLLKSFLSKYGSSLKPGDGFIGRAWEIFLNMPVDDLGSLTLRDKFAMAALASDPDAKTHKAIDIAKSAYELADAMMEARQ